MSMVGEKGPFREVRIVRWGREVPLPESREVGRMGLGRVGIQLATWLCEGTERVRGRVKREKVLMGEVLGERQSLSLAGMGQLRNTQGWSGIENIKQKRKESNQKQLKGGIDWEKYVTICVRRGDRMLK